MKILITGGLGFIGSHTVVELIKNGHTVVMADNLINSKIEVLDKLSCITDIKPTFYQIDVTDETKVEKIFVNHKIDGVIHFAGLKAVGESVSKPLEYYYNNLVSTMVVHFKNYIRSTISPHCGTSNYWRANLSNLI